MPLTRSSGKKDQNTKNSSEVLSEVFKTPLKDLSMTPKSSRKSGTSSRTRCDSEPSNSSSSNVYICRVCQNTERLNITEFRNFEKKVPSDHGIQLNNNNDHISSDSYFSIDHLNRRVIKSTPP